MKLLHDRILANAKTGHKREDQELSEWPVSPEQWQQIVTQFTAQVKAGKTQTGFIECIESCGALLKQHAPATHEKNELPDRLVVLRG